MTPANLIVSFTGIVIPLVTTPWWVWVLVIAAMLAVLAVSILIRPGSSEQPPAEKAAPPSPANAVPLPESAGTAAAPPSADAPPMPAAGGSPQPAVPVAGKSTDDLKLVRGVSPSVVAVLNSAGIVTFAQLAAASVDDLEKILRRAGMRQLDPATWPHQARLAAAEDWDNLSKLQQTLPKI